VCVSVCKVEELDGDFGGVGWDTLLCEEEMEETGVAGFEGVVGGDGGCCSVCLGCVLICRGSCDVLHMCIHP